MALTAVTKPSQLVSDGISATWNFRMSTWGQLAEIQMRAYGVFRPSGSRELQGKRYGGRVAKRNGQAWQE